MSASKSSKRFRVRIYTEGGGELGQACKNLDIKLRRAFKAFITKSQRDNSVYEHCSANFCGHFTFSCDGSRESAYDAFVHAYRRYQERKKGDSSQVIDIPLLLVDSEALVKEGDGPWQHLHARDGWTAPRAGSPPKAAQEEHVHLMAGTMENWFMADQQALEDYFGEGFQSSSLPSTQNVEQIEKRQVYQSLQRATEKSRKGSYDKGRHSYDILQEIDPLKVQGRAPWLCRFLKTLDDLIVHQSFGKSIRECTEPS